MANKKEILEKIEKLIELEGDALEKAAEQIAPDFDYEAEAAALAAEEKAEREAEASGSELEEEIESEAAISESESESEQSADDASAVEKPLPPAELSPSKYPRARYSPKTALGRAVLKDRHSITMSAVLVMLIGVMGWWTFDYIIPLCRAENTTAIIAGVETEIRLIPGTIKDTLDFNDISYDSDDIIEPGIDETGDMDTTIVVKQVELKTEERREAVKYESKVILDPELESGVQEKTEGKDGVGIFTYTTKYVDGEEAGTERELKEWIEKPQDKTLRLGTKRTGHKGSYKIKSSFTANCSAYWMGNNCYGASGGKCEYGTVAVDRSKYPYGTMFWIEGYGFAVANDCGTSIKGDKLDLWMDSYAESCRWGRRHMKTYVLEELK